MINLTPKNKLKPERGRLLVSYPLLSDPYFKRTVILLCEHNEEGSFGFVLNKYINIKLSDLLEDIPPFNTKIAVGGPVQTSSLYYIHTLGERIHGSVEVLNGLYMGGDYDDLRQLIMAGEVNQNDIRFFVGYSGWGEKQLDGELEENSWIISEAKADTLMNTNSEKLWRNTLVNMGKEFAILANIPENPELN
jgi:putative transcriptional regulator